MKRLSWLSVAAFLCVAPMTIAPTVAAAASKTITASGPWSSHDGLLNGTWFAHFDVAGYDLSGTLNLIGLPGVGEGNIQGSWDLQNIGFGVLFLDQELASFDGGIEGDEFKGTFTTGDISGNWSGLLENLVFTSDPVQTVTNGILPTLLLNRTGGKLGEIVNLAAKLQTLGQEISEIENVLSFDSLTTPITAQLNGLPNCVVNAAINKADTIFEFLPQGCSGTACTQVRAIVRSLTNTLAIPDGANLFTCKVKINKKATTGIYQIVSQVLDAVNSVFEQIPVISVPGEVSIKRRVSDCHCATIEEAGPIPTAGFLLPLAMMVATRFRRRNSRA